ncbi:hypothetical protein AKJ51_00830 [candidate division MSBL1 archaeon SCGC-AAA382A20]|uniref:PAS domain-containing protein n=1 Tax=candidate division MSBL1 archaeon SCGC-AAA382A20 TaxID=1698280 RepID=A0A133VMF0_9EURY|nr:hypothetical protein AKJ51_00830 [candidate division MSBL1 archaeon SCGC-AAA382A20]
MFREVNEAAVEVLGYEKEEIKGKSPSEVSFFPPETKEKIQYLRRWDFPSFWVSFCDFSAAVGGV